MKTEEEKKEEARIRANTYYERNRAKVRASQKAKYDPKKARDYQLRAKFGISSEEYDRLLAAQGGVCGVCSSSSTGRRDRENFAVDHDHQTGKVRGLLCVQCNTAAGNLRDSPDLCLKLASYLKKSGAP